MTDLQWLKQLVDSGDIASTFDDGAVHRLARVVDSELIGCSLPTISTGPEFEHAVDLLRKNLREWSNRLSQLIVAVHDVLPGTSDVVQRAKLQQFAGQCPWRHLRDVASGFSATKAGGSAPE